MKVIVAGAGIGGLAAALSLHAAGIDALVIDAAITLKPLGVGINLMPHAVRELTELGLGDELAATGILTAEHVHFDRHGNRIWGFASGLGIGYRWPQYSIHRGELQRSCWPTGTCPPTGCCTWSACARQAGSAGSRTCSPPPNWPRSTRPTGRPRCRT